MASSRTRYVALLRGINLGRAQRLAMADLRELLTSLGHSDLITTFSDRRMKVRATLRNWNAVTKTHALAA